MGRSPYCLDLGQAGSSGTEYVRAGAITTAERPIEANRSDAEKVTLNDTAGSRENRKRRSESGKPNLSRHPPPA
jgi:hypothetical protein